MSYGRYGSPFKGGEMVRIHSVEGAKIIADDSELEDMIGIVSDLDVSPIRWVDFPNFKKGLGEAMTGVLAWPNQLELIKE